MYKFSIKKELFEDIMLKKVNILEKKATNYWKKEILVPKIIDESILFEIKNNEKLILVNGLGEDKPKIIIECLKTEYIKDRAIFRFYLGKILEQKNINDFQDEKDILIKELLNEKDELMKILENLKKSIK
ncbi:hypothetical protein ACN2EN_05480 [Aliarcobacter lanthieri]|uniref:hypothetical protein n=1 Tax=Aliarcobacter lanthieri TaxID=1355374 RepID=UPI00047D1F41|nr:hypothetical protein [Aliarcobacter lanthieri]QKF59091.1 hypothetical protein ALANTH_0978 [Aliarcobacter lanthieri]